MLFFSSGGKRLPRKGLAPAGGRPAAKGRALVNLLPELGSDGITTVLPLPQDESLWESLHLVFATAQGGVRRNRLSDFRNVRAAGLIAMKLDEGDRLIGVATCREGDDVLLATRRGRCIRFQITDDTLRVFSGRESSGVRGIRLGAGDEVISLSVLRHVEATSEERIAYLRHAAALRRRNGEEEPIAEAAVGEARGECRPRGRAARRAHRRAGGGGGNPAHRHRWRLRQAQLRLRIPRHRARRAGDRQHHAGRRAPARPWPRPSRCAPATT